MSHVDNPDMRDTYDFRFEDDIEHISTYIDDGNMIIHLGDVLDDRYKTVHKLASTNDANVWLCRDIQATPVAYYAVKVMMANASGESLKLKNFKVLQSSTDSTLDLLALKKTCLPLQISSLTSARKHSHDILVYAAFGPSPRNVPQMRKSEQGTKMLRDMCLQLTRALAGLHTLDVVQGDLLATHVLCELGGLSGLSEQEVLDIFGKPGVARIGPGMDLSLEYTVYNKSWNPLMLRQLQIAPKDEASKAVYLTGNVVMHGFSRSFLVSSPKDYPHRYLRVTPPEFIFDKLEGIKGDIWKLGCAIFEIRTGQNLFEAPQANDELEYLTDVCLLLGGPMPEAWWNKWEDRDIVFEADGTLDDQGRYICHEDVVPENLRSIKGVIENISQNWEQHPDLKDESKHGMPMTAREIDMFADLLGRIFKWDPTQRPTADEIAEHPWFKL